MVRKRRRGGPGPQSGPEAAEAGPRPVPGADFQVDEEVDLHGLAVDEAMAQAAFALERHRGRRGAILRFIHGHSSGMSGSIKGALKRNLETLWKGWILSARPEPGNPGSTLVKLGGSLKK